MSKKILVFIMLLVSISNSSADGFSLQSRFIRFIKFNGPLVGVDLDKNGIRDDVEKEINKKFPDQNRKSLALLWAHHYESILRNKNDRNFDKNWWANVERLSSCSISLLYYGIGISISKSIDDRYWVQNKVFNRSNRWEKYIDFYNNTYYLGNINQDLSLDSFEAVILMKDICSFKILGFKEIQKDALKKSMEDFTGKHGPNYRINLFEKKFGTNYRNVYEKYIIK